MKTFITSLALCAAVTSYAAITPKQVEWSILQSPLTLGDLPMTASGQMIWGDYNNDGLIDAFIISGQGATPVSGLYKNLGNEKFTEELTDISMLSLSSAVFVDYDNDGNLDLLVAGSLDGTPQSAITELYHNSGAPNYEFILVEDVEFPGVSAESGDNGTRILEAVDYNNDGWMDLFVNGNAGGVWDVSGDNRVVALYKNNKGVFELQTTPVDGRENFRSVSGGSLHCGDVNNDGFMDLIVTGYNDEEGVKSVTDLYLNNGAGGFSKWAASQPTFTGHNQGETFFVDVNNDGWLDIIEIGRDINNGWANFAKLYINNKDNTFTTINDDVTNLLGGSASVAAGDINNDGWNDLLVCGWGPNSTLFYNNGDNSFTQVAVPDVARARAGCANFVDFNKDNNLDMTIFGYRDGGDDTPENPTWPDHFLKNMLGNGITANQAPAAPANFSATRSGEYYLLTWDKATDDTTPQDAIRYNVSVKFPDGKVYSYVPADATTGMLKVAGMRSFIMGNSIKLYLPAGDYTFGVQAVDNSNATSLFVAPGGSSLDNVSTGDVKVFANGKNIEIRNAGITAITYQVISAKGQLMANGSCAANQNLPVEMAQQGVYFVQVSTEAGVSVQKVMIF